MNVHLMYSLGYSAVMKRTGILPCNTVANNALVRDGTSVAIGVNIIHLLFEARDGAYHRAFDCYLRAKI